jgi:hypothetical protein
MKCYTLGVTRRMFVLPLLAGVLLAQPSPTSSWSSSQKEQFLLTATILNEQFAGKGITNSQKATLSDGHVTHAAHIQSIDIYTPLFKGKDGSQEQDFKDSWKFNVAAYRLAKLLNLSDMVPVSVSRTVNGRPSSIDWWVDGVLMDERERVDKNIQPPDAARWRGQMDTIRVFDQLIYNMDRSQENLIITTNWDVWMIDHTRAFRKWTSLRNPAAVTHCKPQLLEALRGLRRPDVARELGPFLTDAEIDGLMARRDLIVAKLEGRGDGVTLPNRTPASSATSKASKTSRH